MTDFLLNLMTIRSAMQSGFTRALVTAIVALQLVACGGGGGGNDAASTTSTDRTITGQTTSTSLTGSSAGESTAPETVNTGSASLSWTAPVTRADGTPLSLADIGGFYIYYGESKGRYPNRVALDDGTAQAMTMNNIPVGVYYMVMTTYDVYGRESSYSPVVKKTVL